MKNKMKLLCALAAVLMLGTVAYAAVGSAAGTANDPLVTLSYLTGVFTPQMEEKMDRLVTEKGEALEAQFDEAIARADMESGSSEASVFAVVTLTNGQVLTGDVGCELLLRVGTAQCRSTGSTGLIDCTDGSTLADGEKLVKNHLYMVTISTRSVVATADTVKVLVRGPYTIEG